MLEEVEVPDENHIMSTKIFESQIILKSLGARKQKGLS
jgi:hypothetical protein